MVIWNNITYHLSTCIITYVIGLYYSIILLTTVWYDMTKSILLIYNKITRNVKILYPSFSVILIILLNIYQIHLECNRLFHLSLISISPENSPLMTMNCLRHVSYVPNVASFFWIVHSSLPLRLFLIFVYIKSEWISNQIGLWFPAILYNYCTWMRSIWGFMEQSTTILNEANAKFNIVVLCSIKPHIDQVQV
jgi:hypothetical protein